MLLGIYLTLLGGGPELVVAALGVSLITGAGLNMLVGKYGDRFGRRNAMAAFGLLMVAAGGILAAAPSFPVALAALALGATSPTGTEVGPFLSVEQSIVADVAQDGRRTRAFAAYNMLGSLGAAAGALASGIPTLLLGHVPTSADPLRPMFLAYAALGGMAALLAWSLPRTVEVEVSHRSVALSPESRTRVARIAALFAADSYAGGLVIQSFVSLWFYDTYPESRGVLPIVFFSAGILTTLSFFVAARLGEEFGLLGTMVFTHIPSNVFLILVPLAPGFAASMAFYLARMALSQMDVPTRQAYLAGIVAREERTAANATTNTARNVAQAAGPFSSGGLLAVLGLSAPFFLGGGIKIAYDLAIFASFRKVRPQTV